MDFLKIEKVKNISSIGGGPIGGGWTAFFLSKGYNVTSYLHHPKEKEMFMKIVKTAWKSLKKLGLAKNASLNNLSVMYDLKKSLEGTDSDDIKKKTQNLIQVSMKLGEAVYKSQQKEQPKPDDNKDAKSDDKENVVDADFEDVKEDKEKSA